MFFRHPAQFGDDLVAVSRGRQVVDEAEAEDGVELAVGVVELDQVLFFDRRVESRFGHRFLGQFQRRFTEVDPGQFVAFASEHDGGPSDPARGVEDRPHLLEQRQGAADQIHLRLVLAGLAPLVLLRPVDGVLDPLSVLILMPG